MGFHLLGYTGQDEDGWYFYVCTCGHRSGTFATLDDLVDGHDEHRATTAAANRCRVRR